MRIQPRLSFYVFEFVVRFALAFLAFLLPLNVFSSDVGVYWEHARDISFHHLPYTDFIWEYPPLTVLPLLYLPLTGRSSLGFHLLFLTTMIGLEWTSMHLIRRARPEHFVTITRYWSLLVIPMSMLVWYRFDYMSIFFATVGLIAIEKNRPTAVPIVLGYLSKLWPLFICVGLFAQRKYRQTFIGLGLCVLSTITWWLLAPGGFHDFVRYRQGEGFQAESLPGSLVILLSQHKLFFTYGAANVSDAHWHWLQPILTIGGLAAPVIFAVLGWRWRVASQVLLIAATVAWVLCFSRLISSQFIIWLAPFMVWLWPERKRLGRIYGVVVLLTLGIVWFYPLLAHYNVGFELLLVARNASLVWLATELAVAAFRAKPVAPAAAVSS